MVYNDRFTNSLKNKESNRFNEYGYISDTNRSSRRKEERDFQKFENSVIRYINKDWWDCVSEFDKNQLYRSWKFDYRFNDIRDFLEYNKGSISVDKSLYRDKKINRILDDGVSNRI